MQLKKQLYRFNWHDNCALVGYINEHAKSCSGHGPGGPPLCPLALGATSVLLQIARDK